MKNSPHNEKQVIQPFLKWAGNKRSIIDKITQILPSGDRLIEPFCGSAAVFLNTNFKDNLICDTNSDLINLYHHIQTDNLKFIKYCEKYFISENNTPEKYYEFRERFNKTKSKRLRAALFLYLNKHGYNGLCRYNKSGQFNVPVGKYKKVTLPRKKMEVFANKTACAKFMLSDYAETMRNAEKGDVIYCDPPYVPLNESNSSFQYEKNGFSIEQQIHLAILAEESANRGIPVLISNHLTDFTKEIYEKATLTEFSVQRNISCKGDKRTRALEVLALFR